MEARAVNRRKKVDPGTESCHLSGLVSHQPPLPDGMSLAFKEACSAHNAEFKVFLTPQCFPRLSLKVIV